MYEPGLTSGEYQRNSASTWSLVWQESRKTIARALLSYASFDQVHHFRIGRTAFDQSYEQGQRMLLNGFAIMRSDLDVDTNDSALVQFLSLQTCACTVSKGDFRSVKSGR